MYWNGKYREAMNVVDNRYNELQREIKNDTHSTNVAGK